MPRKIASKRVKPSSNHQEDNKQGTIKVTRNIRAKCIINMDQPVKHPRSGVLYVYNVKNWENKMGFYDKIEYSFGVPSTQKPVQCDFLKCKVLHYERTCQGIYYCPFHEIEANKQNQKIQEISNYQTCVVKPCKHRHQPCDQHSLPLKKSSTCKFKLHFYVPLNQNDDRRLLLCLGKHSHALLGNNEEIQYQLNPEEETEELISQSIHHKKSKSAPILKTTSTGPLMPCRIEPSTSIKSQSPPNTLSINTRKRDSSFKESNEMIKPNISTFSQSQMSPYDANPKYRMKSRFSNKIVSPSSLVKRKYSDLNGPLSSDNHSYTYSHPSNYNSYHMYNNSMYPPNSYMYSPNNSLHNQRRNIKTHHHWNSQPSFYGYGNNSQDNAQVNTPERKNDEYHYSSPMHDQNSNESSQTLYYNDDTIMQPMKKRFFYDNKRTSNSVDDSITSSVSTTPNSSSSTTPDTPFKNIPSFHQLSFGRLSSSASSFNVTPKENQTKVEKEEVETNDKSDEKELKIKIERNVQPKDSATKLKDSFLSTPQNLPSIQSLLGNFISNSSERVNSSPMSQRHHQFIHSNNSPKNMITPSTPMTPSNTMNYSPNTPVTKLSTSLNSISLQYSPLSDRHDYNHNARISRIRRDVPLCRKSLFNNDDVKLNATDPLLKIDYTGTNHENTTRNLSH